MKVFIYVEGDSDKLAMQALLRTLLERKRAEGKYVSFVPAGGKNPLLLKYIVKAADFVHSHWSNYAVILPDLYPKNMGVTHDNIDELRKALTPMFVQRLKEKGLSESELSNCLSRFNIFCFKHDLEVLVLAAEPQLLARLDCAHFPADVSWNKTVENQNNTRPPKRVIEEIFKSCNMKYRETTDAALILSNCQYQVLADKCPESFKPLIDYIEKL